ncbi:hypothetical protein lerEdw1_004424 [Lerista edwardsae]|nr:hypothetical protein lerEdw1_004424 [Lerista edwardsae]
MQIDKSVTSNLNLQNQNKRLQHWNRM